MDRVFILGLMIHGWDCYLSIFLASCVIVALPFQLHDLVMVMRVVTALNVVGPIGRGRDVRFTPNRPEIHHRNQVKLKLTIP